MRRISEGEYHAELKSQKVDQLEDLAFVCPMCGTVQSARDFMEAGLGRSLDDVWPQLGFQCIGRWKGAPAPRREPDGRPCNWTLGGFLQLHTLEVVDARGRKHPSFEPASADQAHAHMLNRRTLRRLKGHEA